jgi:hypothetical protein
MLVLFSPSCRYVSVGRGWLNGDFSMVAKVSHFAGSRVKNQREVPISYVRACLDGEKFWVNSCSTFRCYLAKFIQLWTN